MMLPEQTNFSSEKLNPFNWVIYQTLTLVAGLTELPIENYCIIKDGAKLNLNPLSADFGANTALWLSLEVNRSLLNKTPVNFAKVFGLMADGLSRKNPTITAENNEAGEIFRALDFYHNMASLLPVELQEFTNLDSELLALAQLIKEAANIDESRIIVFGLSHALLNPDLSPKVRRKIKKRAVLMFVRSTLENHKNYNLIIDKLHNLDKVYQQKPNGKIVINPTMDMVWQLHHIIIPIVNTFEEQDSKKYPLTSRWQELAFGKPFSKPTNTLGTPKRTGSSRLKKRLPRRGVRGPQFK